MSEHTELLQKFVDSYLVGIGPVLQDLTVERPYAAMQPKMQMACSQAELRPLANVLVANQVNDYIAGQATRLAPDAMADRAGSTDSLAEGNAVRGIISGLRDRLFGVNSDVKCADYLKEQLFVVVTESLNRLHCELQQIDSQLAVKAVQEKGWGARTRSMQQQRAMAEQGV